MDCEIYYGVTRVKMQHNNVAKSSILPTYKTHIIYGVEESYLLENSDYLYNLDDCTKDGYYNDHSYDYTYDTPWHDW